MQLSLSSLQHAGSLYPLVFSDSSILVANSKSSPYELTWQSLIHDSVHIIHKLNDLINSNSPNNLVN